MDENNNHSVGDIDAMRRELAALRAGKAERDAKDAAARAKAAAKPLTCKVSEKGALSIYGLGRFPVTLYISQFDKLTKNWDDVVAFAASHRSQFTTRDE